jgi:RimJ/RimL family protein N-acetyltransferase
MILVLEADLHSVELRRIVVANKGLGIGQTAMSALQEYCSKTLQRGRIWLDVYVFNQRGNQRGRHAYEKLGYQLFKRGEFDSRKLLYLQKSIDSDMLQGK